MTRCQRAQITHIVLGSIKISGSAQTARPYLLIPLIIKVMQASANVNTANCGLVIRSRGRNYGAIHIDQLSMTPKPFEVVVGASGFRKYMDEEVAIVHQHPVGGIETFQTDGKFPHLFQLLRDLIRNSMSLTGICRRADDEVIGKGCHLAEVEDTYVGSFFRLRRPGGNQPIGRLLQLFGPLDAGGAVR